MGVPGGSSLTDLSNEVFDYIYHGSGKGWVRFCIWVWLCFYVHGLDDTQQIAYDTIPPFPWFSGCASLTGMMDIGRWLKMVFIQNDRVCFATSDLSDGNNFREAGRAPGTHSGRTSERFIRRLSPRYLIANSFTIIFSTNSILGVRTLL